LSYGFGLEDLRNNQKFSVLDSELNSELNGQLNPLFYFKSLYYYFPISG